MACALVGELDDRLAVDRVVQRLAHELALERREVLVELDEVDPGRREEVDVQSRGSCRSRWIRLPGGFSMMSAFLLSSISTRVLSSGTIRILDLVDLGLRAVEVRVAARSTSLSGLYEVTKNGPLPTGCWKKALPCDLTSFCGTTEYAYMARSASSGACFSDSVMTTVCASGAVMVLTGGQQEAPAAVERARPLDRVHDVAGGDRRAVGELGVRTQVEGVGEAVGRDLPRRWRGRAAGRCRSRSAAAGGCRGSGRARWTR